MNKFKDFMIRRRYSPRTIEVYTSLVGLYLSVLKNRNPDDLTDEDIGNLYSCEPTNKAKNT